MKREFPKQHFTDMQVARALEKIKAMDHDSMGRMWRAGAQTAAETIYFRSDLPVQKAFNDRFFHLFGGVTPELCKRLGWELS